ncbi:MAG TPA: PA14 domain-containing protein, partial [Fimbriimonadales bacterium]|nr:PA14 domain-containing protein [Fimbriimonadales bacterium]
GFKELDIKAGSPLKSIDARIRTPLRGYLPIYTYGFDRDGAHYEVQTFAWTPNLDPRENLIAFERITVSNRTAKTAHVNFSASIGNVGQAARVLLSHRQWYTQKFNSAPLQPTLPVEKGGGAIDLLNGRYLLYSGSPIINHDAVMYSFDLAPGKKQAIDFKMPFVPIHLQRGDELDKLQRADFASALKETVEFWESILGRAFQVEVDDTKVVETMKSSLIFDLIARDIEEDGKHFTQTVNKFQYHSFYARDTSFIARSYELMNLPDVARETIEKYVVRDESGKPIKLLRTSPDDWGQSLWALGAYIISTGDVPFANEIAPALAPHLEEFDQALKGDPLGLWPVAGPYDNELIDGHYTSHNLWALLGLRTAEKVARMRSDKEAESAARSRYDLLFGRFQNRLASLTKKTGGYIPPGMDDPAKGFDWENASGGVYPFAVFGSGHPWAKATIALEREYKYREGIMTWGPNAWVGKLAAMTGEEFDPQFLHDYDTFQVTETCLDAGMQREVVEDLYSTLVHTSSTNGGFETSIRPWGDRNPGDNFPPHGWFAARYNELVRNMLIREDLFNRDLHIFSALAPKWVEPGKTVRVANGANDFGSFDLSMRCRADGADIELHPKWRTSPDALVVHFPWFLTVSKATADGAPVKIEGGMIRISPNARSIRLDWTWNSHPDLSYERAVEFWLNKNYKPKRGEDMDHLFATKTRPGLADSETMFLDKTTVRLASRSGMGEIHFTLDGTKPTVMSPKYAPLEISASTVVRAIEVYPDGSSSDEMLVRYRKIILHDPVIVAETEPGANYEYYAGDFAQMPSFDSLKPSRIGVCPRVDTDAIPHIPEKFAIRATGLVDAPEDGIYTFYTGSDDGSVLLIDGEPVVDNDGLHAYQEHGGRIGLCKGLHHVEVQFFDAGGAASLHVFWKKPQSERAPIPGSAWRHQKSGHLPGLRQRHTRINALKER